MARYFALFGLQPHRGKSFKLSTDPFFVEKVRDVVGLYLNPPDKALVLWVDEKSQIQALKRTQPVSPIGLGYVEGVTHDYYRHGTTTLFAALNVLDGGVISQCKLRHRRQEFCRSSTISTAISPPGWKCTSSADNYATHKHPRVKAWLARHRRYRIHYTPTYASWLNQVERWFALVSQQAIRRGSFRSVPELVRKIDAYVTHYNTHKLVSISTNWRRRVTRASSAWAYSSAKAAPRVAPLRRNAPAFRRRAGRSWPVAVARAKVSPLARIDDRHCEPGGCRRAGNGHLQTTSRFENHKVSRHDLSE